MRLMMWCGSDSTCAGEFTVSRRPRSGAVIRVAASEIQKGKSYGFSLSDSAGRDWEWRSTRSRIVGDTAEFRLKLTAESARQLTAVR